MKIPLSSHPETIYKLIQRSFMLYRQVFTHVFLFALAFSIIIFIPSLLARLLDINIYNNLGWFDPKKLWFLLINFISLVFFTALIWRIRCMILDTHESFMEDIRIASKKIPYIFIAYLIQILFVVAINLFLAGILFYISFHSNMAINFDPTTVLLISVLLIIQLSLIAYFFLAFYFYLPIILIENNGIIPSLAKSAKLVWKNWWRTYCVQITPWVAYLFCLHLLNTFSKNNLYIYFFNTAEPPSLFVICINILLFAIFIPWVAASLLMQLHDLELRKMAENPL